MNLPTNTRVIDLVDEQVTLNPNHLTYNDANLTKFMEQFGVWYDYYSSKTTKAEEYLANCELGTENRRDFYFLQAKSEGLTEKASEAHARIQPEVIDLKARENQARSQVKQMKEFLKALDKTHAMAKNRSYMLCQEMGKLGSSGYSSAFSSCDISDIIGGEGN